MAKMYINAMTSLWNSLGTTYSAIKMTVTDSGSNINSLILDLIVDAIPRFTVKKNGDAYASGDIQAAAAGATATSVATLGATQTLTNKTLTSPVLTTPQINNPALTFQYVYAGSAIVADRTVTLPLLTGNDSFVFAAHTQTLTNKTLTSPTINGTIGSSGTITFSGAVQISDNLLVSVGVSAATLSSDTTIIAGTSIEAGSTISAVSGTLSTPTTTATSIATLGATQTLTNKTLTSPTINGATISGTFTGTLAVSAVTSVGAILPSVTNVPALGSTTFSWADLFLGSGAVVNFNSGNMTITQAANTLTFGGSSGGNIQIAGSYNLIPAINGNSEFGSTTKGWAAAHLSLGASVNWVNGDATIFFIGSTMDFDCVAGYQFDSYDAAGGLAGVLINDGVVSLSTTGTALTTKMNFVNANGVVGTVKTTGVATQYNTSSDGRKKTNLRAFDSGAFLDALEVWHFDWIAGGSGYGVIAQDAEKVFPDATSSDEGENYQVDYSKFVPLLIKEIQGLRKRVAELEGRN